MALGLGLFGLARNCPAESIRPNILLIAVDDLRPELNCYGQLQMKTPNIDRIARDGMLFNRAFTQQAVCGPSRNTLLTGLRPDKLGIYNLTTDFRTKAPDVVTLPQYFKQNGYRTEGIGKLYHGKAGKRSDDAHSWSCPSWAPDSIVDARAPMISGDFTDLQTTMPKRSGAVLPWAKFALPEEDHDDAMVVSHAIERFKALKDVPFFLGVGLKKPHLPFVAPAKYWDLYDPDQISIPAIRKPAGVPDFAFSAWEELRKYYGMPEKGPMPDEDARQLIHGYYACVSFVDAQIGRLTAALKELGLYENTIIVIWGDHGWKLGDYGDWCKHTNFEIDTRIPLIFKGPGINTGAKSDAIVETVDVYPTLCDLAGLPPPDHLQGSSFLPALRNPSFSWEDVAFSQYPRKEGEREVMGTSMRTDRYRYTQWIQRKTGKLVAEEVYDHFVSGLEMTNLVLDPEKKELVASLRRQFEKEYQKEHR